jgi:hypothetical protein
MSGQLDLQLVFGAPTGVLESGQPDRRISRNGDNRSSRRSRMSQLTTKSLRMKLKLCFIFQLLQQSKIYLTRPLQVVLSATLNDSCSQSRVINM